MRSFEPSQIQRVLVLPLASRRGGIAGASLSKPKLSLNHSAANSLGCPDRDDLLVGVGVLRVVEPADHHSNSWNQTATTSSSAGWRLKARMKSVALLA